MIFKHWHVGFLLKVMSLNFFHVEFRSPPEVH